MITDTNEQLDIFDEAFRWIGTASRAEVHKEGYWHQTFQCWVRHRIDGEDWLLLQRRHASKDTNPGKFDVSCAGHLGTGESPKGGTRELAEELGIHVEFERLFDVGMHRHEHTFGFIRDREFCHVYLFPQAESFALTDYRPAVDEISGLYLIHVPTFARLCNAEIDGAVIRGYSISEAGHWSKEDIHITLDQLVERTLAYYDALFQYIESLT